MFQLHNLYTILLEVKYYRGQTTIVVTSEEKGK